MEGTSEVRIGILGAARIALQLGQFERAAATLHIARRVAPDHPQVRQLSERLRAAQEATP